MAGSVIRIEGLEKTLARFDIKKFEPKIQKAFNDFGIRVELLAKDLAPVDEGHLKGSIFQDPGILSSTVGVSIDYAAYVEFGTRKYAAAYVATLPPDWQTYAATFKGKSGSGSFDQFVQAIMAWVERKGIGAFKTKSGNKSTSAASYASMQQAAYWIAINILQNGLKPHPFFYPAFNTAKNELIKQLQELTFDDTGFSKQTFQRRVFR